MEFLNKKYKRMLQTIENYRNERDKLREKVNELEIEKIELEDKLKAEDKSMIETHAIIKNLSNSNEVLSRQNKELIEWIDKMINEVGCYTVPSDCTIKIPIMRGKMPAADGRIGFRREEVHIPSITYQIFK